MQVFKRQKRQLFIYDKLDLYFWFDNFEIRLTIILINSESPKKSSVPLTINDNKDTEWIFMFAVARHDDNWCVLREVIYPVVMLL